MAFLHFQRDPLIQQSCGRTHLGEPRPALDQCISKYLYIVMAAAPLTAVLKTLADPTRRAVFERIAREGEVAATGLVRGTRVSQPAVSQHLRALREAGLIVER